MNDTQNGEATAPSGIYLDGIDTMIEDRMQYERASALCLLSIAYSAERIAAAAERVASRFEDVSSPEHGVFTFNTNGI